MLIREHFEVKETAVTIITDDSFLPIAKDAVFKAREIIEKKIFEDPFFKTTYEPYAVSKNDDPLIQRMCRASVLADVGPMASVAGAVSTYAVERLQKAGSTHSIVENGGDIALISDREITVGIFAGKNLQDLSLKIPISNDIYGICSSSGTVGPSVSLGTSEISTVFSEDVILADASATQLGNLIRDGDSLEDALETIGNIEGIKGCLAVTGDRIAILGELPEIVKGRIEEEKISRIRFV